MDSIISLFEIAMDTYLGRIIFTIICIYGFLTIVGLIFT